MSQTRRLAAILAADVAGYSRLMGADQEGTLERLKALRRELLDPKIAAHRGRIVTTTGMASTSLFAPDRERTNPDLRIFEHRKRPALQRRTQSRQIGHQQRRLLLGMSAALLSEDDN